MKIFVIPSWFPPNGGSFFLEQSKVLNEITEQIVLYVEPLSVKELIKSPFSTLKKLFTIKEENDNILKIIRTFNLRVPKFWLPNIHIEKFVYLRLYRYAKLKYGKPDLLHVHSSIWGGWYAYAIKNKYNIPYIITEHRGRFTDTKYAKMANQLPIQYDKYLNKIFSNASYICPVSTIMIKKILTYSNHKNIKPIYNLVNEELFYFDKQVKKRDRFTFITVAGLIPLKGIDILLKAFAQIETDYDVELLIIGDGSERQKLVNFVQKNKLDKRVSFLGFQDRESVAKYMKESHVFVLPTKYEAFGVVFVEALACGLPLISTKNSGGPDDIINKENGLLVEIKNIKELYSAMIYMIKNYSKYNLEEIAKSAKKRFGKEYFQNSYKKIYQKVLNGRD